MKLIIFSFFIYTLFCMTSFTTSTANKKESSNMLFFSSNSSNSNMINIHNFTSKEFGIVKFNHKETEDERLHKQVEEKFKNEIKTLQGRIVWDDGFTTHKIKEKEKELKFTESSGSGIKHKSLFEKKVELILNELKTNLVQNPENYFPHFRQSIYEFKQILVEDSKTLKVNEDYYNIQKQENDELKKMEREIERKKIDYSVLKTNGKKESNENKEYDEKKAKEEIENEFNKIGDDSLFSSSNNKEGKKDLSNVNETKIKGVVYKNVETTNIKKNLKIKESKNKEEESSNKTKERKYTEFKFKQKKGSSKTEGLSLNKMNNKTSKSYFIDDVDRNSLISELLNIK